MDLSVHMRYFRLISYKNFGIGSSLRPVRLGISAREGTLMSAYTKKYTKGDTELSTRTVIPDRPRFSNYEQAEKAPDRDRGHGQGR